MRARRGGVAREKEISMRDRFWLLLQPIGRLRPLRQGLPGRGVGAWRETVDGNLPLANAA